MTWLAVPHELAVFLSAFLTRTLHNFLAQRWWCWIWSYLVRKGMLQKGRTKVEWKRWRRILYGFNTGPYNSDLTPLAQCASFATDWGPGFYIYLAWGEARTPSPCQLRHCEVVFLYPILSRIHNNLSKLNPVQYPNHISHRCILWDNSGCNEFKARLGIEKCD